MDMILGTRYVEVTPYIFVERSIRDMHIEMQGPTIIESYWIFGRILGPICSMELEYLQYLHLP